MFNFSKEQIHEAGAHKFGADWLFANEAACNMASKLGISYTGPEAKHLMPGIVFAVLLYREKQAQKTKDYIENYDPPV